MTPTKEKSPYRSYREFSAFGIIFLMLLLITTGLQLHVHTWSLRCWTTTFMGLFFITFSMFKFLDLKNFVNAFRLYDLGANHFKSYGYIYPVIESILGIGYLTYLFPFWTNLITVIFMGFSACGAITAAISGVDKICSLKCFLFKMPYNMISIIESIFMGILALMFLVFRINALF